MPLPRDEFSVSERKEYGIDGIGPKTGSTGAINSFTAIVDEKRRRVTSIIKDLPRMREIIFTDYDAQSVERQTSAQPDLIPRFSPVSFDGNNARPLFSELASPVPERSFEGRTVYNDPELKNINDLVKVLKDLHSEWIELYRNHYEQSMGVLKAQAVNTPSLSIKLRRVLHIQNKRERTLRDREQIAQTTQNKLEEIREEMLKNRKTLNLLAAAKIGKVNTERKKLWNEKITIALEELKSQGISIEEDEIEQLKKGKKEPQIEFRDCSDQQRELYENISRQAQQLQNVLDDLMEVLSIYNP